MLKFNSIKNESVASEYKEKGSKFIGKLKVVTSPEEAMEFVNKNSEEHPQAVHTCFAYKVGLEGEEKYRYSDDGEPSNSAGAPIFGQINSFDLTNIVIVVIRYYGGVNLGVGGLINAYRTAAKEAIELAEVTSKLVTHKFKLDFDYSDMAILMSEIKKENFTILEQHFEQDCYLIVDCNEEEQNKLDSLSARYKTLKISQIN